MWPVDIGRSWRDESGRDEAETYSAKEAEVTLYIVR